MDLGYNVQPDGGAGGGGGAGGMGGAGGSGGTGVCVPGSIAPCYSGPEGTENKGICAGGTKTCNAGGTGYGACVGEVTPKVEDCATPEDEDCDGLSPACKGQLLWAKRFGDMERQDGEHIAVDGAGNVVIVGEGSGSVDFGGGPVDPSGLYVAKLDPDGNHLWSKGFTGVGACRAVAVDSANNVLITGSFSGSIDFGGSALLQSAPGYSMFAAKLDANGAHVWSKVFGGTAYGESVAVDGAGNVLLSGWFSAAVDFGGGPLVSAGDFDFFLAKLDSSGHHVWSKRFGDGGSQSLIKVAVDSAGDVFASGGFAGAVDFGDGLLTSTGSSDMFVAKFTASGNHLWSTRWGGVGAFMGAGELAVDGSGSVLVTGFLAGTVDTGNGTLMGMGMLSQGVFAAKLDAGGKHLWSKSFGPTAAENHYGVAVDGSGNVHLTGDVIGVADFGNGPINGAGGEDALVVKLDPAGGYVWARTFGDVQDQAGNGIALDAAGNVLVVGTFRSSANFGSGSLTSAGERDIFVAKFGP
jgi:hypothetical protein